VPVPGVPGSPASGVPPSGLSDRALMNLLFGNG
jgi:hypothetical protein